MTGRSYTQAAALAVAHAEAIAITEGRAAGDAAADAAQSIQLPTSYRVPLGARNNPDALPVSILARTLPVIRRSEQGHFLVSCS